MEHRINTAGEDSGEEATGTCCLTTSLKGNRQKSQGRVLLASEGPFGCAFFFMTRIIFLEHFYRIELMPM